MLLHSQVAEEAVHLRTAHLTRVSHSMKPEEATQPLFVGLYRASGVVARLQQLAIALDQSGRMGSVGHHSEGVLPQEFPHAITVLKLPC